MGSNAKIYLIAILLGVLLVTLWAKEQDRERGGKTSEQSRERKRWKQDVVTRGKAWALGCAAVLTERNHHRHDLLGGLMTNERNIRRMKKLLANWWGTKSRKDLFDDLIWIENGGHRKNFEGWGRLLQTLSEQEYQKVLEKYERDQETLQEIKITKEHYENLGPKSLLGWDYSRYICLCRWGYLVGYISEEEAWERIMPVAEMLQKKFDSWEDLGQNYLIGRRFWSYKYTKEKGDLYEDAFQRLLDMRSSPWNKYPWDLDLGVATIISDPNKLVQQNEIVVND